MTKKNISELRLLNQQISNPQFDSAGKLVNWMGAIQAQDFNMAKLAVGIRTPGSTEAAINASADKGEIIRTHVLRPTWHFVSPEDIYWMLDLTAPRIIASMKSRDRELELDGKVYKKCNSVIEKALYRSNFLTRQELVNELGKSNIPTGNNRASHIFMRAELNKLICSGKTINKKQTYALLEERVPGGKKLNREESLAQLAQKYFSSHSPATVNDFSWWSGLSVADARSAVEMIKPKFLSEIIDNKTYLFPDKSANPETDEGNIYLLPAYDEFIISYKDRSVYMPYDELKKAVSSNGIFRPVIVIDGKVSGLWKRTVKNNVAEFETEFFRVHNKKEIKKLNIAFSKLGAFMDKKVKYHII